MQMEAPLFAVLLVQSAAVEVDVKLAALPSNWPVLCLKTLLPQQQLQ